MKEGRHIFIQNLPYAKRFYSFEVLEAHLKIIISA